MNLRPSAPKADALPSCATPRFQFTPDRTSTSSYDHPITDSKARFGTVCERRRHLWRSHSMSCACRCSSMVEPLPSKQATRVRFPSSAPRDVCISRGNRVHIYRATFSASLEESVFWPVLGELAQRDGGRDSADAGVPVVRRLRGRQCGRCYGAAARCGRRSAPESRIPVRGGRLVDPQVSASPVLLCAGVSASYFYFELLCWRRFR